MTGAECSVEAYYSLSQIGALTLTGVFNAICDTREITPLFFGFAIGAKVGCGLVAELGTMRVNEEIDALEIMSIPTRVYLVSVRMLACFIVLKASAIGVDVKTGSFFRYMVPAFPPVPSATCSTGSTRPTVPGRALRAVAWGWPLPSTTSSRRRIRSFQPTIRRYSTTSRRRTMRSPS